MNTITVKSVYKFRDKHNNIYGYRLSDINGQLRDFTADQLKSAIRKNQISVVNLKLTSDNRLIDYVPHTEPTDQAVDKPKTAKDNPETIKRDVYIVRTHKIHISKSNPYFKILDDACFKSKNIYNRALYLERQIYEEADQDVFKSHFYSYSDLYRILKTEDCYNQLREANPVAAPHTLKLVADNIKAFKAAVSSYAKTPERFLGVPKFPKYLNKHTGRQMLGFSYKTFRIKGNKVCLRLYDKILEFTIPKYLKGIEVTPSTDKSYTLEELSIPHNLALDQVRVVPKHKSYDVELSYTKKVVAEVPTKSKAASIDLGVNNLATLVFLQKDLDPIILSGKYLKSYNKYFNKRLASLQSKIDTAKNEKDTSAVKKYTDQKLRLCQKRNQYFSTNMHQIASLLVKQLIQTKTTHLVIGYNKEWKQNSKLSKKVNQTFIQIPFYKLIQILEYKCQEHGIAVFKTEESYTSGTSYLDQELPTKQNYNKTRRKHRGMFKSTTNGLINADVNGALQIAKKRFPKLNEISTDQVQYQHPKVIVLPKTFKQKPA